MANSLMGMMGGAASVTMPRASKVNKEVIQSIKRMMKMYRAAQNPQAALQQMAQQDPMINGLMQIGRQNGGLQNVFYTLCSEQGEDPNAILNELKG